MTVKRVYHITAGHRELTYDGKFLRIDDKVSFGNAWIDQFIDGINELRAARQKDEIRGS
jgi:hypothetical protein